MKTRKLVLIIADVLLLAICIIQCAISSHDTTKYFDLKDTPDMIVIDTPEEKEITVVCENEEWFVGKDKFPANQKIVDEFLEAVKSIRVLDKVGSANNDANLDRYELNDVKKTVVTVSKDGKVLRTLTIGKEAVSDSQSYITVDGGKDIYLATGSLPYVFDIITSAIRSEVVFNYDSAEISDVTVTKVGGNENGKSWSVSRMGSGEDVVWNVTPNEIEVDSEKTASWFSSIASMSTKNWYEEKDIPAAEQILSVKIGHNFTSTTVDIFALPKEESVPQAYYAKCSDVPYTFALGSEYVERFQKNISDFAK